MPRSVVYRGAGNINLHGKKYKRLSCGCCDVVDFRDEYTLKLHEQEMRIVDCVEDDFQYHVDYELSENDDVYEATQRYA